MGKHLTNIISSLESLSFSIYSVAEGVNSPPSGVSLIIDTWVGAAARSKFGGQGNISSRLRHISKLPEHKYINHI